MSSIRYLLLLIILSCLAITISGLEVNPAPKSAVKNNALAAAPAAARNSATWGRSVQLQLNPPLGAAVDKMSNGAAAVGQGQQHPRLQAAQPQQPHEEYTYSYREEYDPLRAPQPQEAYRAFSDHEGRMRGEQHYEPEHRFKYEEHADSSPYYQPQAPDWDPSRDSHDTIGRLVRGINDGPSQPRRQAPLPEALERPIATDSRPPTAARNGDNNGAQLPADNAPWQVTPPAATQEPPRQAPSKEDSSQADVQVPLKQPEQHGNNNLNNNLNNSNNNNAAADNSKPTERTEAPVPSKEQQQQGKEVAKEEPAKDKQPLDSSSSSSGSNSGSQPVTRQDPPQTPAAVNPAPKKELQEQDKDKTANESKPDDKAAGALPPTATDKSGQEQQEQEQPAPGGGKDMLVNLVPRYRAGPVKRRDYFMDKKWLIDGDKRNGTGYGGGDDDDEEEHYHKHYERYHDHDNSDGEEGEEGAHDYYRPTPEYPGEYAPHKGPYDGPGAPWDEAPGWVDHESSHDEDDDSKHYYYPDSHGEPRDEQEEDREGPYYKQEGDSDAQHDAPEYFKDREEEPSDPHYYHNEGDGVEHYPPYNHTQEQLNSRDPLGSLAPHVRDSAPQQKPGAEQQLPEAPRSAEDFNGVSGPKALTLNPWAVEQCAMAGSGNYEASLVALPDVEAFRGRASRTCFTISRSTGCGACCSDMAAAKARISIPVDIKACSKEAVNSVKWTLNGQPLDVSVKWDEGYVVSDSLAMFDSTPKRLCAEYDSTGQALSCSTFDAVVRGQSSTLRYRITDDAGQCCFQGFTKDRVSYPGEASIIPAAAAEKLSTVEQQFEVLLSKATSLKQAIKSADAAAATSILQGADADAVAQQADLPLVWPSTVNNPKQVTLNRQLYNFKDQGDAAMAPSFAAIAALEGALDAANSGQASSKLSEKALHWCDSNRAVMSGEKVTGAAGGRPSYGGFWALPDAFEALAEQGAVDDSCTAASTGTSATDYSGAKRVNVADQCSALASAASPCSRTSQFRAVVWTPSPDGHDLTAILRHIKDKRAVATMFNYTGDFENWVRDSSRNKRTYTPLSGAGEKRIAGHAVNIIGWDFSSPNTADHYWIVKDSYPSHGDAFGPQTYKVSRAAAPHIGFLSWVGGFDTSPAPPAPLAPQQPPAAADNDHAGGNDHSKDVDDRAAPKPIPDADDEEDHTSVPQPPAAADVDDNDSKGEAPEADADGSDSNDEDEDKDEDEDEHKDDDEDKDEDESYQTSLAAARRQHRAADSRAAAAAAVMATGDGCASHTVSRPCMSFGQMWEAAGGAASLQSLAAALIANLESVGGHDVSCLPKGLHLTFCVHKTAA